MLVEVGIKKIIPEVEIPTYGTEESAGFDLRAMRIMSLRKGTEKIDLTEKLMYTIAAKNMITLRPWERVLLGTGLKFDIPKGYEMQIRDRSGVALKRGLKVFNAPGTIDSDYTGEVGIIICNMTPFLNNIHLGEKIAQGVIAKHEKAFFSLTSGLRKSTTRGDGGYGSTGNGL